MEEASAVERTKAEHERCTVRANGLRDRQAELIAAIDAAADAARGGNVAGVSEMGALASEKSATDRALAAAEQELETACGRMKMAISAERSRRFDEVTQGAREQRQQFLQLFKQACLVLGAYCATTEEAIELANQSSTGALGMSAQQKNVITELSEEFNPLPELLENAYQGTKKFGWNFQVVIVPLHLLGGSANGK